MAVDYYHHIVINGPRRTVSEFVDRIALVVDRRVAGVTTRGVVPFSFESVYAIARIKGDVPSDPYDMTRWRIARRGAREAEVRYRFHTRDLEMLPLVKKLSRACPTLRFAMVTICLDDMDFAPFTIHDGKSRGNWLGGDWREPFWIEFARERGIDLDDAYEDDDVETEVHSRCLDAAVKIATGSNRRYAWGGGDIHRDLDDERDATILELAAAIRDMDGEENAKPRRRKTV